MPAQQGHQREHQWSFRTREARPADVRSMLPLPGTPPDLRLRPPTTISGNHLRAMLWLQYPPSNNCREAAPRAPMDWERDPAKGVPASRKDLRAGTCPLFGQWGVHSGAVGVPLRTQCIACAAARPRTESRGVTPGTPRAHRRNHGQRGVTACEVLGGSATRAARRAV